MQRAALGALDAAAARSSGRRGAPSRRRPVRARAPRALAALRARARVRNCTRRLRSTRWRRAAAPGGKWRPARSLALRQRAGGEAFVAAGEQALQQRMLRDIRSGSAPRPASCSRPARPATCTMVCASRSAARKSVLNSPWSALSTTTSEHAGKVMSLGDHLRADQNARLAAADTRRECASSSRGSRGRVAIEPQQRRLRKQLLQRLLDAFGALADRFDRQSRSAGSARAARSRRRSDGSSALLARPMHRQPRIAVLGRAAIQPQAVHSSVGA